MVKVKVTELKKKKIQKFSERKNRFYIKGQHQNIIRTLHSNAVIWRAVEKAFKILRRNDCNPEAIKCEEE